MRITLDLNDELAEEINRRAAETDRTVTEVIEKALRQGLSSGEEGKPYRLRLPTIKGKLQPGVDLDDRDSLDDIMEGLR